MKMSKSKRLAEIAKSFGNKLDFNLPDKYNRPEEINNEDEIVKVSKVLDCLYLTSIIGMNIVACGKYDIDPKNTLVINATDKLEIFPHFFKTVRIPLVDTTDCKIYKFFESTADLINDYLKKGYNVIVHCKAGISRSASLVIAYLIKYHNMNYNSAYEFLRNKRKIIEPNIEFHNKLCCFSDLINYPYNTLKLMREQTGNNNDITDILISEQEVYNLKIK